MKVWYAAFKGGDNLLENLLSMAIRFVLKGGYSHTEIVVGNDPFDEIVDCISASGLDRGVRLKRMKLKREEWDIIELPFIQAARVYEWFSINGHKQYDYWGALAFIIPVFLRPRPHRWLCSVACADIIGIEDPWRFNPSDLTAYLLVFIDKQDSRE